MGKPRNRLVVEWQQRNGQADSCSIPGNEYPEDQRGDSYEGDHTIGALPAALLSAQPVASSDRQQQPKAPRRVPPYAPFPLAMLPPVLRDYVDASAAAIGCDPALVALPAMAVAAGCVGNSCAVRLKRGWTEPSVLWAVTIAQSGQLKSPGWAAAVDPLLSRQCDLAEEYQINRARYDDDLTAWKDRPKSERGPRPDCPDQPPCYITGDATIEAVGELLGDNPRGLLIARDELDGWFQGFVRYGRSGSTDRPHWLELHRAGTLRLHRLTREHRCLTVRRACCSITGTIQPQVLASALDDNALAAGLGARFLLAMPSTRKRRWSEAEVDEETADRYGRLLRDLLSITLADPVKRTPNLFVLAPPAKEIWREWFGRWGDATDAAEGEQAAALAKLEGYAARLALVHHVVSLTAAGARGADHPITETSLRAAIALVDWFAGEAVRVYTILRETNEERDCRRLVEFIEARGGSVYPRDLQRANARRWPSSDDAEAALEGLAKTGIGEWREVQPGPAGGRPTRLFCLKS
jgi:hypothetical protein